MFKNDTPLYFWGTNNPGTFAKQYCTELHKYVEKPSFLIVVCEAMIAEFMQTKGNYYSNLKLRTILDRLGFPGKSTSLE